MTQDKVSERVGKSRAAISNHLRLLRLPAQIQLALQKKEIDMGHARALLSLDSPSMQIKVFKEILKHNFSVRQVEDFVAHLKNGEDVQSGTKTIKGKAQMPEKYLVIRDALSKAIGSRVTISCTSEGKGKITIPFTSEKQLKEIMKAIE
jgi:ParB family chromosome partitioning protein